MRSYEPVNCETIKRVIMETFFIPTENDFRRWVKDAVRECLLEIPNAVNANAIAANDDTLLNRKEVANFLRVSLVTLTDWMKRGLPFHKQRGRVYFMKSEVVDYIQEKSYKQVGFLRRFP